MGWFGYHSHNDERVRDTFGNLIMQALSGKGLASWHQLGWRPAVAAIIALDQFPRMVFRGKHAAFAGDADALTIAKRVLADEVAISEMPLLYHYFASLPLQHS